MSFPAALKTIFRILSFRANREEIESNAGAIIVVALIATWIVGVGRWWDDPRDLLWFVRLGLGSVIYVIALSSVLWMVAWPISDERLGYPAFLAFVASTSLPGLVYAVPIEKLTGTETASIYNQWALLFVSVYRISLLLWFMYKPVGLSFLGVLGATFLPISMIVLGLTMLGHGAAVMDIMGGFRGDETAKSGMEEAVGMLGCLAWIVGPVSLLLYLAEIFKASYNRSREP